MRILAIGSVAMDDVKTPFGEKKNVLGGSASHFSVAASFLSLVEIVGVIGKDFPEKHLKYLQSKGVDTTKIQISDEPTFHWKGHYEYDMAVAHTDDTKLGAFANFNPKLNDEQKKTPYIFLGNIDPDIQMDVLKQVESPRFLGMDTMNFWIDSKKQKLWNVIKKVDTLFINDAEIRQLAGEASLVKAARAVQKKGPKRVLVKKGEHGILAVHENELFLAAAFPTEEVKDPTGAGDSFAGGVVSYLEMKGRKMTSKDNEHEILKQAVVWGAAVASFSVEGFSTSGLDKASVESIRARCHSIHSLTQFEKHE